jgi:hypothetical protein
LAEFDAIDDCSILRIPIVHVGKDGRIEGPTPLFNRFQGFLGSKNSSAEIEVHLGLLCLLFSKEFPTDGFISILFSEFPLKLNRSHRLIPKSQLLFIVRPFTARLYHIACISKKSYWFSALGDRIIAAENIAAEICRSIFQFVALEKRELFFTNDEARSNFLREIETVPVSLFRLLSGYALNELSGHQIDSDQSS